MQVHASREEEASDLSVGVEVGRVVWRAALIMWCSRGVVGGVVDMVFGGMYRK